MNTVKDLTEEAPTSPRKRVGGYAILPRMTDKARASLEGKLGEYHFDCPLDNMLFGFKNVKGSDVLAEIKNGANDEDIATWLNSHGDAKTPDEIKAWGDQVEGYRPYDNPEKKEWFAEQCKETGVDPATNTLFDWLEADDKKSYSK